jgi:hypothetical protein
MFASFDNKSTRKPIEKSPECRKDYEKEIIWSNLENYGKI